MKILITGGAGFVGSNLAINLKKNSSLLEIYCLDNLRRRGSELNLPHLIKQGIYFFQGDIRNKEDFLQIPSFDLMLECSAEPSVLAGINSSPEYLINTNLIGTLNCLEEVRKKKAKIIFLSTSRVYPLDKINSLNSKEDLTRFSLKENQQVKGITSKGINENFSLEGPRSLYGATKLASELFIQEYFSTYNIDSIINRCGLISGPGQFGKSDQGIVVSWVFNHFIQKPLKYIGYGGEGKQVRDFLHIGDLYSLINYQIHNFNKLKNQTFNVGGGLENSSSLQELTKTCSDVTGKKIEIYKISKNRKMDIKWFITDSSKIQSLSCWKPKKNLNTTVSEIYNWIFFYCFFISDK